MTCNGSAQKHRTAAAGRVLRVQGSPFQERCLLAALKRGSSQKKLFISVQRKEARAIHAMARAVSMKRMLRDEFWSARVTCNGSRFEDFTDSIIYYVRVSKEALHYVKQYQHDAFLQEE